MLTDKNYQIAESIADRQKLVVDRGRMLASDRQVIYQLIDAKSNNVNELALYGNHYQVLQGLHLTKTIAVIDLQAERDNFILTIEDFGDTSLDRYFSDPQLRKLAQDNFNLFLEQFLKIALQIAESVYEIHLARIIHKDIKPANIQIDTKSGAIKLTNFNYAVKTAKFGESLATHHLAGTLAYMSPEQTGRIDRQLDYRSDLYAIGVTFYELLTGNLPFEVSDPLALIHCHLTKSPVTIDRLNESIPPSLAAIVAKLMAKNVADRYQSAGDLWLDLDRCLAQLRRFGKIENFALGTGAIEQSEVECLLDGLANTDLDSSQFTTASTSVLAEILARVLGQLASTPVTEIALESVELQLLFKLVERCNYTVTPRSAAKMWLVRLNQLAGHQAYHRQAHTLALEYARFGLQWLGKDWVSDEPLAVELAELTIELAAICGELALMEELSALACQRLARPLALIGIQTVQIELLAERSPLAAIELAKSLLVKLGVELPPPTGDDVECAMGQIDSLSRDVMLPLPPMTDPHQLAIVRIAARMMAACYATDPHLYALVVALQVNLSLRYGTHPSSAYSYAVYGRSLLSYCHDLTGALRFSSWAEAMANAPAAQQLRSKTSATIGLFLAHRTAHLRETIPIFQAGYAAGLATGRLGDASANLAGWLSAAYWSGENLSKLALLAEDLVSGAASALAEHTTVSYQALISTVQYLLGNGSDRDLSADPAGDRQFAIDFYSAIGAFVMGDLDRANSAILQARARLVTVAGSIDELNYYFYDSLIALATADADRATTLERVHDNQRQLAAWAESAPVNYLHKWQLVEAEYQRLGDVAAACEYYDLAIATATANDYHHEAALASEIAAKFYLDLGDRDRAVTYLQAAERGYRQWGAIAKVRDLSRNTPIATEPVAEPAERSVTESLANGDLGCVSGSSQSQAVVTQSLNLDFETYTRAIAALASETDLDRLLRTLMDIVVAYAGADKATLLLSRNGNLTISLEYDAGELETMDFDLHSFDRENYMPLSLIRDVYRTQTTTIYDRDRNPYIAEDPYFMERQPLSILCLPICIQGRAIGILYLENWVAKEAFTPDRIELLEMICTQAAISVENARLHQESQAYAQELERSLHDLQMSQARLQKIADSIPGAIAQMSFDSDLRYQKLLYISSGCHKLYEITAEEMLAGGYSLRQFEHPEDRSRIDLAIAQLRHLQPTEFENRIITASGNVKWIYLATSGLEPQPDGTFLLECTVLDVSQRQAALQERERFQQQLQLANEELVRSNRLKDQFLTNMSHELRTPLNAILGMTEALQERIFGAISTEQSAALATIATSGTQLLSLINDVLELARIEAGELKIDCSPTEIGSLCKSCLVFIKQQAFRKQHQIELRIQPNLPELIVDGRLLRQAIVNLLLNAVKFTPAGGQISLEVTYLDTPDFHACDDLATAEADGFVSQSGLARRVRISVTDTGIGIAPGNLKQLFQPFVQIDGAFNRQFEGTGLGLALVKRIVDLHDGSVSVSSELSIGSSFTIELPCTKPLVRVPASTTPELESLSSSARSPQRQPLILLAEDNEANIHTMSSYLRAKGYQLVTAHDGHEAIEQTKAILPDLILMDIQMPTLDGLSAIEHIRQFSDVPIIALTALADDLIDETLDDREKCLAAGATDYLTKPVKLKHLTTTIQQLLVVRP